MADNIVGKYVDIDDPINNANSKVRVTVTSDGRIKMDRGLFSTVSAPLDKVEEAIAKLKETN